MLNQTGSNRISPDRSIDQDVGGPGSIRENPAESNQIKPNSSSFEASRQPQNPAETNRNKPKQTKFAVLRSVKVICEDLDRMSKSASKMLALPESN